jgi:hypothetical protein
MGRPGVGRSTTGEALRRSGHAESARWLLDAPEPASGAALPSAQSGT